MLAAELTALKDEAFDLDLLGFSLRSREGFTPNSSKLFNMLISFVISRLRRSEGGVRRLTPRFG
jgi:hypothetical protein